MTIKTGVRALKALFDGLNNEGGLNHEEITELGIKEQLAFIGSNNEEETIITPPFRVVLDYEHKGDIVQGPDKKFRLTEQGKGHLKWLEEHEGKPRERRL